MPLKLLKNLPKCCLFLTCLYFAFSAVSLEFEEEDIACKDLPTALSRYNNDTQLERHSFKAALRELSTTLRDGLDNKQLSQSRLLKMVEDLEDMNILIQENDLLLSNRADNIQYFLKECLQPSEEKGTSEK